MNLSALALAPCQPLLLIAGVLALTTPGSAQVIFSIDSHGPTIGLPDSLYGLPITEGDLIFPASEVPAFGPMTTPGIGLVAGPPGAHLGLATYPNLVEVDAFSLGFDYPLTQSSANAGDYVFSTDEFAVGMGSLFPGDLLSEALFGDSSADIWITAVTPPFGPLPPTAGLVPHTGLVDGDGLRSGSGFLYPGLGLLEPNPPSPPPDLGDTLDAMDLNYYSGGPPPFAWFSLDEAFIDPRTGVANSGSGPANGFAGADILWTVMPGVPMVYAPASMLGLNLVGLDDLDALALVENGTFAFEPSQQPYDWNGGATDMVLFSVRRGSAVIGQPDSIFGVPIEEGDILTTPLAGGVSPFPGIFCAAETIGLATARSTSATFGDDLNALDTLGSALSDCNGNGQEDVLDVIHGLSTDGNVNKVPDECELLVTSYCFCTLGAPCGNADPLGGCRNSTGLGARLTASGTSSVSRDDLVLTTSQLPANQFALTFMANSALNPTVFGDGFRCSGGGLVRFGVKSTGPTGRVVHGPGLAAAHGISPLSTFHFHTWYRDPGGPCGNSFNTSNAVSVSFLP